MFLFFSYFATANVSGTLVILKRFSFGVIFDKDAFSFYKIGQNIMFDSFSCSEYKVTRLSVIVQYVVVRTVNTRVLQVKHEIRKSADEYPNLF